MRIAETDFILIPEWLTQSSSQQTGKPQHGTSSPDEDHWISRWQRSIASASWLETSQGSPADALVTQCAALNRPVVIVTHGHGIQVLLAATSDLAKTPIAGAFIVAPSGQEERLANAASASQPLPYPSVIVAPDDHPVLPSEAAERLAQNLGGHYVAAGAAGRLDAQSGHGPWPDGLMRLGWFLKRLGAH